jgi:flavodoxin
MKALVVYESMFGNTEQIARAVAAGLGESVDVQQVEVTDAPTEPDPDVVLIVAGRSHACVFDEPGGHPS